MSENLKTLDKEISNFFDQNFFWLSFRKKFLNFFYQKIFCQIFAEILEYRTRDNDSLKPQKLINKYHIRYMTNSTAKPLKTAAN